MRKKLPGTIIMALMAVMIGILAVLGFYAQAKKSETTASSASQQITQTSQNQASELSTQASQANSTESTVSSSSAAEPASYPDLSQYQQLAVHVSTAKQEMTITSNDQVIFTTTVSTGAPESPTPTGQFVIEAERGDFFYNASSGEGAYYWVSFKDHGIYLFHSLPTDEAGNEIPEEAARLGTAASHGCVRMPRATAKWFYENIPEGTPVIIS